jgi:hypothetical protein
MWHKAIRILACYKNKNLIFDTITEASDFFSSDRQKLHVSQLRRIIDKNGLWCYQEEDGTYSDVIFDELYEGDE